MKKLKTVAGDAAKSPIKLNRESGFFFDSSGAPIYADDILRFINDPPHCPVPPTLAKLEKAAIGYAKQGCTEFIADNSRTALLTAASLHARHLSKSKTK